MQHAREFFLGFILSILSWETWENMIISLIIAFLGGIAAAAGKNVYAKYFNKNKRNG